MKNSGKSFPANFLELTPCSWNEAKLIGAKLHFSEHQPYIFRGQGDNTWLLETSIERLARRYKVERNLISNHEIKILETFKSRAHHYTQPPPTNNENLEWLSIIQDFGGPTRLLDFTESFYIASFFAVESAEHDACVWAISEAELVINSLWSKEIKAEYELNKRYLYNLEKFSGVAEKIIRDPIQNKDWVLMILPPRLNERLSAQKGLFLFNCNLENNFENSLCKTLKMPFENFNSNNATKLSTKEFLKEFDSVKVGNIVYSGAKVLKINLSQKIQQEILGDLDMMNINYASLFPGLEGFAKYMRIHFYKKSIRMDSFILHGDNEK